MAAWIQIRILNADPDGGLKKAKNEGENVAKTYDLDLPSFSALDPDPLYLKKTG
jgi:hypothetical protein